MSDIKHIDIKKIMDWKSWLTWKNAAKVLLIALVYVTGYMLSYKSQLESAREDKYAIYEELGSCNKNMWRLIDGIPAAVQSTTEPECSTEECLEEQFMKE